MEEEKVPIPESEIEPIQTEPNDSDDEKIMLEKFNKGMNKLSKVIKSEKVIWESDLFL